jgi:hypothetical protein
MHLPIPSIFWITLLSVPVVLALATLTGRAASAALPYRLQAVARFYLAPALGLALWTILASILGRILPLGNTVLLPILTGALLLTALARERCLACAYRHALLVAGFGLICGISVLAPLLVYGSLGNPFNDAFTYLAHGQWLQENAFGATIPPALTAPATAQVTQYQQIGLRMGGSFLLAMLQTLLNLRWTFEVYATLMISAIAACCLSLGFILARTLRPMSRMMRLVLLALPALSLGGLIFGANSGFLPQTLGLALSAGFLFLLGPSLRWLTSGRTHPIACDKIILCAVPTAIFLIAATFAYSELAPFLGLALGVSAGTQALRTGAWRTVILFCGMLLTLTLLVLNLELMRLFAALRIQAGAVVGVGVDWQLQGFLAHALGLHGGVWDPFQWNSSSQRATSSVLRNWLLPLLLLILPLGLMVFKRCLIWRETVNGALLPTITLLVSFGAGLLYFRYAVKAPFALGVGQSWSQFKLSEWAHPFLMAPLLLALASLRQHLLRYFDRALLLLFGCGILVSVVTGVARVTPLMPKYTGVADLNRFHQDFRATVWRICPASAPIYLALGVQHIHYRQLAVLYLAERELHSDWTDDGYFEWLPASGKKQVLEPGDCLIEPNTAGGLLKQATKIGPFQVGMISMNGSIALTTMEGAYQREEDGVNWWHWVPQKISFAVKTQFVPQAIQRTRLRFDYISLGAQTLTLNLLRRDHSRQTLILPPATTPMGHFDQILDRAPADLIQLTIETNGKPIRLGPQDPRMATWMLRNLDLTPISP